MKRLQKYSTKGTGYVYTNTRVRVMKSKLLNSDDFEKLMKISIPEIARFLEEREYKKEFDELGRIFSGSKLIEYALNKNIENQFFSILKFSVRSARKELELYLKRFDIMNIKTILRGKLSGTKNEDIMNEIIAAGSLDKNFFKEIAKAENFEQAVESLNKTEYYPIVKKYQVNMPRLEDELDRYYYSKLLKESDHALRDFIIHEISLKNIALSARAKKHGINFARIHGGQKIKIDDNLKDDSVELRTWVKKNLVKDALKMASVFSRNIIPAIGYFVAKENEIGNIRIVVRGEQSDLDESTMRQQIILGG